MMSFAGVLRFCGVSAKLDHRLTLFYVCNDIVQICKRKHALVYKDAFKDVLKDATLLVRYGSLIRCLKAVSRHEIPVWQ